MHVQTDKDHYYMAKAYALAERAAADQEVPVGAVLVKGDQIIAQGWNRSIAETDPTAHAEVVALRQGAQYLNNYRLLDTTLYVTLEPCLMCAGAMVHARVTRLVYGASDPRAGAVGGAFDALNAPGLNHRVAATGGVMAVPCAALLQAFFKARRGL
jgi:tRNA(adenine34) deaminase